MAGRKEGHPDGGRAAGNLRSGGGRSADWVVAEVLPERDKAIGWLAGEGPTRERAGDLADDAIAVCVAQKRRDRGAKTRWASRHVRVLPRTFVMMVLPRDS